MNALVFLYKNVLDTPIEKRIDAVRPTKNRRIPEVISLEEVKQTITYMEGIPQLVVKLLNSSGLRITEGTRLRVQDIDFDYKQITIRSGKDNKDRVTTFSETLIPELNNHLQRIKLFHEKDVAEGFGAVFLSFALERKYPNASKEWNWQYVFPSRNLSIDPRSDKTRCHHFDQSVINKTIKRAVQRLGITNNINARYFVNLTWLSSPIPARKLDEQSLFVRHWQEFGK